jgi:hypothetical protein
VNLEGEMSCGGNGQGETPFYRGEGAGRRPVSRARRSVAVGFDDFGYGRGKVM